MGESAEALCSVLIHAISQHGRTSPDGTVEYGPVNVVESFQTFERVLHLIKVARCAAGVEQKNKTLSSDQMKQALHWLACMFEDVFLESDSLKQKIQMMDSGTSMMTEEQKRSLRDQRCGAFRSWKWRVSGNVHLFHAMASAWRIRPQEHEGFHDGIL